MPPTTDQRIDTLRQRKAKRPPLTYREIADCSDYSEQYVKNILNGRGLPVDVGPTLDHIDGAITKARGRQRPVEDRYGRGFAVAD